MESLADFGLTEMQLEIKSLCRRIGEEKIVPVREHHDETGEFPHDRFTSTGAWPKSLQ